MTLSIGIPSYNQAEFLEQTIRSLLGQTVSPYEIVVSDDHSTDGSQDILRMYQDRIRFIVPPKHLGMAQHWNYLVSELQGDWFSLLSSDDLALPNLVSALTRGIGRSKTAVLVRTGWDTIDVDGALLDKHYLLSVAQITRPPQTLLEQIGGPKNGFIGFAARKAAWEKVGGFPEECNVSGDWGLWIKLSTQGEFIYENEITSQYRCYARPTLQRARMHAWLEDEVFIQTKLIPQQLGILGEKDTRKAVRRSKARFRKALVVASTFPELGDRTQVSKRLEGWAAKVGGENLLMRFKDGRRILDYEAMFRSQTARRLIGGAYSWILR